MSNSISLTCLYLPAWGTLTFFLIDMQVEVLMLDRTEFEFRHYLDICDDFTRHSGQKFLLLVHLNKTKHKKGGGRFLLNTQSI